MPQRGAGYLTRHQSFIDIANKGDVDILFIGDSITDNWNRVDRGKPVWDKYYGNAKAANFGIGSDKTQNVLWRVQNGELPAGFKPKVAVMLIGTNNVGGNTPAEIAEGVGAIIKEFRTRTPDTKILLLAIFPRDYKDTPNRLGVFAANQQVSKLDDGKHVFYFDIGQRFLDGDGNFIPGLFWDTPPLHPIVPGYTIWAEAIKEPLDNLLHGKDLYGFPIPADEPAAALVPAVPPAALIAAPQNFAAIRDGRGPAAMAIPTNEELKTINTKLEILLINADPGVKDIFDKYPDYNPMGIRAGAGCSYCNDP